mgnify:CR=1 FL=1
MANADVGKLTASIALDVSNLTKGVAKADQQLEQLSTSFQKSQKKVNSSLNSIDTKVAITAKNVVASIRAQTNQINAQMATQRNLLTKSLGAQTKTLEASMQQQIRATQKLSTAVGVNTSLVSASIMAMNKNVTEALSQMTSAFERMSTRSSQSMTNARKTLSQQAVQMAGDLEKLKVKAEQTQVTLNNRQTQKLDYKATKTDTAKLDSKLSKMNTVSFTPTMNTSGTVAQVNGLENALAKANAQAVTLSGSLSKAWEIYETISFSAFKLVYGIDAIGQAVTALVSPGWQLANLLETEQIGMAGILSSMTSLHGESLKWNDAMAMSKSIMKDLTIEAAKTAATSEELISTFRALLGPGLGAGMNIDEIKQFTVTGVNAVKSMGLEGRQLVQELRDLVQGGIQAASSTLATALGLTDSDIKAAKQSSEGLFKFLMKRLEGFKQSSTEYGNTLSGMLAQVKEGYALAQVQAVESLRDTAKGILKDIRDVLYTKDMQINPAFVEGFKTVGDYALKIWEALKDVGSSFMPAIEAALNIAVPLVKLIVDNLKELTIMFLTWNIAKKVTTLFQIKEATDSVTSSQIAQNKAIEEAEAKYKKAQNAAMDYANSYASKFNAHVEANNQRINTNAMAGQVKMLGSMSNDKSLQLWGEELTKLEGKYKELGASANEAAKYANLVAEVTIKGSKESAKELDREIQKRLEAARAAEKEYQTQLKKNLESIDKLRGKFSVFGTVTSGVGDALMSLGLILGLTADKNDESAKQTAANIEQFGFLMVMAGNLATTLTDTLVPAIMKAVEWFAKLKLVAAMGGVGAALGAGAKILSPALIAAGAANYFKKDDDPTKIKFDSLESVGAGLWRNYIYNPKAEKEKLEAAAKAAADKKAADEKEKQEQEARIRQMLAGLETKFTKPPTGGGSGGGTKGKASADRAARNQAKNAYKVLETALKAEKEAIKQQQLQLESAYKFDLTSTQDYMQTKFKYDSDIIEAEIKNYEKRREIAKSLGQDSDVESFTNKISELKESAITKYIEYVNDLKDKYKELYDRLDDIKDKYEDIVGVSEEAFKNNLVKEYAADFSRVYAELATAQKGLAKAQEEGNTSDIKAWSTLIDKMQVAKQQLEQIVYLKKLERDAQEATAKAQNVGLQAQSENLDYQLSTGVHSDFQKESDLWIRSHSDMQSVIDQYRTAIANYTAQLSMANSEERKSQILQNIVDAKQAIKDLMDEVHPLESLIRDNLVSGLSDAFQSIYWGEKSAKDALQDFANTFLQTFTKKMFDTAFDELFSNIFDGISGRNTLDTDVVTNVESRVTVDMTKFQQDVTDAGLTLQQELNGQLIPSFQALNSVIQEILAKAGVTSVGVSGATGISGVVGSVAASAVGQHNTESTTIGSGIAMPDLSSSVKGLERFDKGVISATGAITEDTAATKISTNVTDDLSTVTKSTGNSAMPALMAAVTAVSGSLGKFGTVLQTVMMIMQIGKAAKLWAFADGGAVSGAGTGTSDSIPARLSNGEYVIKASSARALGTNFLDRLNSVGDGRTIRSGRLPRFKYADGGEVRTEDSQLENTTPMQQADELPPTVGVNMYMTFQSLDPETNMKLFNKQYENFKSKLINDIQKNTSMRTAIRGVT